ncbi:hypothetical protein SERLA73DRAFT_182913 [Serpula lacrymans var. lacrymans S7.3]|uniref:PPPDE domain-containing protein n=2 Tax=Serpula lacrymans var. lacrymans TaxID=341189 RepID=F8Q171_SERL3|nr:hypothetical protein SERLA73DRAFT_182913 [Serpula lacrymans var. lacrymans S7.3]
MSMQLTGRQIDGVWHTSIVVYGKEIFYGQGISIVQPGQSHHGAPLQIVDMGETALDEETFTEYLTEMREHYTADKYHLLDFNCNSFTNDCIGFLTGGSIPSFIKDLPADFLSTPFGAALRPTIDAMFRGQAGPARPQAAPAPSSSTMPDPALTASLLQAVAARAASGSSSSGYLPTPAPTSPSTPSQAGTASLTAPIHVSTNPASFNALLRSHRAVIAFFTSATCGPCRMIEPVFEELANAKSKSNGVAFTKIDLSVGMGGSVASEWGVRVTPTFIFFLDGKKSHELKGVNGPELRTQVDLLIFQAFPPHPHTSLSLPTIQALSLNPILFTQVPALESVSTKLQGFIDAAPTWSSPLPKAEVKQVLTQLVLPYLKAKHVSKPPLPNVKAPLDRWAQVTLCLSSSLAVNDLFPLVDMWRLALLDPGASTWCASNRSQSNPTSIFLTKANDLLENSTPAVNPRNFLLTVLRMFCNAFSSEVLARELLSSNKTNIATLLVNTLLHSDATVRTAAASLAFNCAGYLQKLRVKKVRGEEVGGDQVEDGDWEVELTSAIIEAIDREEGSEEVVHRLSASIAFLLRLSPFYETQMAPLLEVLQARTVLKNKLEKGGCGPGGVTKQDIRKLVLEVAEKLCP